MTTMSDQQAEQVLLAVQQLAIVIRDEGPEAVIAAGKRVLNAASGDPIAALAVAAALLNTDEPSNAWWQPPREPRPPRQLRPCGTASSYARHLNRGENPDQACRDAHNRERKARRWARTTAA